MKNSRTFKFVFTALMLALFVLAAQPVSIQAGQALPLELGAAAPPYLTYLPVVLEQTPVTGRLTSGGKAVAGQRVVLLYTTNNWTSSSEFAEATSNANGEFALRMPPLLTSQHQYQTFWRNTSKNEAWLASFYGNLGSAQSSSHHYNMEIANIKLLSPAAGASVNMPVTFIWRNRGIPNDNYGAVITNEDETLDQALRNLGNTDRVTFQVLPSWVVANTKYYWYAFVETPSGYGFSYWEYSIYFKTLSSLALDSAPTNSWEDGLPLPANPARVLPNRMIGP